MKEMNNENNVDNGIQNEIPNNYAPTTFTLKTQYLGSDEYAKEELKIDLALPEGTEIVFKDKTGVSLRYKNVFFIFQTLNEDIGIFDEKASVETLKSNTLGTIYRIDAGESGSWLEERFKVNGNKYFYYTDKYSEDNCEFAACGSNGIYVSSSMLSVYCIVSDNNDVKVCDKVIEDMSLNPQ